MDDGNRINMKYIMMIYYIGIGILCGYLVTHSNDKLNTIELYNDIRMKCITSIDVYSPAARLKFKEEICSFYFQNIKNCKVDFFDAVDQFFSYKENECITKEFLKELEK